MRILLDTSLLVEGERRNFDLGKWVAAARHEVLICDATVAEYLAGKPWTDAGKEQRWQNAQQEEMPVLEQKPSRYWGVIGRKRLPLGKREDREVTASALPRNPGKDVLTG